MTITAGQAAGSGLALHFVLWFIFTTGTSLHAQSVTSSFQDGVNGYNGARDTRLHVNPSRRNFGDDILLEANGRPDRSALLYWDISSIPDGSVVTGVDIEVNVTAGTAQAVEIYESLRNWVEAEATWDEYASGQTWEVGGADGAGDRGTVALGSLAATNHGMQTFSLNIAGRDLVQSWVDNPASNRGLVVLNYTNGNGEIQFSSRETPVPAERPRLVVTYDAGNVPSLSIDDVAVFEGDAGTTEAIFTLTLSEAGTQTITVDYATADGTATAGQDYNSASGQVSFAPGELTKTISIAINGDELDELEETFFVDLSNAAGATLADNQGSGTITDDDPAPGLSITDASALEGGGAVVFTVSLSAASGHDVSVDYATTDGTAASPGDYTAVTGTLTIPAGTTSGTISVLLVDDAIDENDETFTVILSNAVNATLNGALGTGTITDDDATPTISIADASALESDGVLSFTVSLSAASSQDVAVGYATTDGTATAPADYIAASGTLTIPAGSTSVAFEVTIIDDADIENDESFTVDLSNAANATLADGQATGTIVNDEGLPSMSIDNVAVAEGDVGTTAAIFTVILSAATPLTITVDFTTTNGTAVAPADYSAVSGQLSFAPGETSQTVSVTVNGETIAEGDETFTVDLSNVVNATLADNQGVGTITNDDPLPDLSIADVSADEAAAAISFTVLLSAASSQDVTVDYATADGAAMAPADYTAASGTMTIPAGSTSGAISVPIVDDALDEADETFVLQLSNAAGAAITDGQAQGTITDNDAAPALSIADASASEGAGSMEFTVNLSVASGQDVTVDYSTTAGTASEPGDFTATAGTLTIAAGSTSGTISVPLIDDAETESPESFTVDLSNPVNATLADLQGAGMIIDNEGLPSLSISDATVVEGNSGSVDAAFTVTLSVASAQTVTVDYTTTDGTAVAEDDYVSAAGQASFAAGETSKLVNIAVNGDALDEINETFVVDLSNAVGADIADSQGVGTITDDDATPSISIADLSVDESVGTMSFTVTLSAISGRDVTVDYATTDGTAVSPADYTATSGTLTIPAGSGSETITFGNIGDFGVGGTEGQIVADKLLSLSPDFITTNGDNNYPDGEVATWQENVLDFYSDFVDSVDYTANRFYATLGNHDYHVFPAAFLNGLALPPGQGNERYYDIVKGPVHFFALDSNSEQPDGNSSTSIQAQWLQSRMEESTAIWKIVLLHHAPWSSGRNHGNSSTRQWPYDEWGADAVFAGHDHTYERILKDEDGDGEPILYFVNGIGGNDIYQFATPIEGSQVRYNNDFGVMLMKANSDSITYQFHSVSEGLIDEYTVHRTGDPSVSIAIETTVTDDAQIEDGETFTINLSNPVNATIADGQATGTIEDNDAVLIVASFQEGVNGYAGAQDTKMLERSVNQNYGSVNAVEIDGSPLKAALLQWDISSISPGSNIESVEIAVDVVDRSSDSYEIYEVLRPWVESEATWSQYAQGLSWEAGGANGALDRGSDVLGGFTASSTGPYTTVLNEEGIAVVQSWVDNPALNHGFLVMDYLAASNGLDFSSREATPASVRPKLTVTYTESVVAGSAFSMVKSPGPKPALEALPETVSLRANYPNPFNLETRIEYTLPEAKQVRMVVYNAMGQQVRVLVDGEQRAGVGSVIWNGRDDANRELGSGVYFVRMAVDQQIFVQKTVLQK